MKKMPEKEEMIDIHRYLSGQMDGPEKEAFEHRIAGEPELADLVREVSAIWSASWEYHEPEFSADTAIARFDIQFIPRKIDRRRWLYAAAAVLLVLLVVGGFYLRSSSQGNLAKVFADTTVEKGLEDGSKLHLREGAIVKVPETFGKSSRKMEMVSGDVYFDIAPDAERPFVISHPWAEVKVVGTEFVISVDTLRHLYTLMVTEGKVKFTPRQSGEESTVSAGSGLRFDVDAGTIQTIHDFGRNAMSWHTGKLSFINTPVKQVLTDLKNHYGVEIDLSNSSISECLFTAPLPYQDVSVNVILQAIATAFGSTVQESVPGHYVLSSGKCK